MRAAIVHDSSHTESTITFEAILLAEPWQIFLAIVGTMFVGIFLLSLVELEDLNLFISVFGNYLPEILLASWFYIVGSNLHRMRPPEARLSMRRFVFNLAYFLLYSLILLYTAAHLLTTGNLTSLGTELLILLPFHAYAVVAAISIVAFVAKALVCVTDRQDVRFHAYAGTFLALFFFPFGIWYIQPRIQAIVRDRIHHEDDLGGNLIEP